MHDKKLPPNNGPCAGDPIDQLQKLGNDLRINSTPTLFFADGRREAGSMATAEIEKNLSMTATDKSAGAATGNPAPAATVK